MSWGGSIVPPWLREMNLLGADSGVTNSFYLTLFSRGQFSITLDEPLTAVMAAVHSIVTLQGSVHEENKTWGVKRCCTACWSLVAWLLYNISTWSPQEWCDQPKQRSGVKMQKHHWTADVNKITFINRNYTSVAKRHINIPLNTCRNNNVVITSKRRILDVITSRWRRFDVITTSLLHNVSAGIKNNVIFTPPYSQTNQHQSICFNHI